MTPALLVASLAFACAPEEHDDDHVHPDDLVLGHNAHRTMQGLAHAGRWTLPADVSAVGDQQDVEFDNAPNYDGGSNCSGGPTEGALTLRDHLIGYFPQIETIGVYNCRVIAGTNSMSLHGVGRALDIMLPTIGGDADNDLGDPIAHWLIENAEAIGVQTIIWDHSIWRVSNSPRQRAYSGSNPHVDHLHVELNIDAANELPPWFQAPFGPDVCEDLPAVGAEGVVVDDGDQCFQLFGPAQYWRHEAAGHEGALAWTDAWQSDDESNWARWSLPLSAPGTFEVQVFIDDAFGVFASTRYAVTASGAVHEVVVDQGGASGWTTLGTFAFSADGTESVAVYDNHEGAVGDDQHIVADALRVRVPPTEPAPTEPEEPGEDPAPGEDPVEPGEDPEEPGEDPVEPGEEGPIDDPGPVDDDDPGLVLRPAYVEPAGGCAATEAGSAPVAGLALVALAALGKTGRRRRTR